MLDCGLPGCSSRVVAVSQKIPAEDIINKPVAVIINLVARHFSRVDPDMIFDVRVRAINARINHRDDHARAARAQLHVFKIADELLSYVLWSCPAPASDDRRESR